MPFAKVLKTKQYFKRYQTKFRRRRECKTDYYARSRMVLSDANKYGSPKYRLVVRFSNTRVNTQIVYSTLKGDNILCEANSSELAQWGLTTGTKSYSAAYATGLLLARRLLKQIGLDTMYTGAEEASGNDYNVAALAETYNNAKRPFKAILDIGLTRSTIGNRVYAVLKGACDGGLHIPHNTKKFYGSWQDEETKKWSYEADSHRARIFGCHIDEYMAWLDGGKIDEETGEAQEGHSSNQFTKWKACLKAAGVDSVEALFTKIHAAIRANPERVSKGGERRPPSYANDEKTLINSTSNGKKVTYVKERRLNAAQRRARVQAKIRAAIEKAQAQ